MFSSITLSPGENDLEKKNDWNTLAYRIVTLATGVVEPWEAILTLSFFFAVVVTAYMADRDQYHITFYGRIFMNVRNKPECLFLLPSLMFVAKWSN
jgi:hypothetical protein